LAPWGLALFPEPMRWAAMVIGLPLAWALAWFMLFHPFHATPTASSTTENGAISTTPLSHPGGE